MESWNFDINSSCDSGQAFKMVMLVYWLIVKTGTDVSYMLND